MNCYHVTKTRLSLWKDITVRGTDSVLVNIKISKNRSVHGETVDLCKYGIAKLCPVRAMLRLTDLCKNYSSGDRPVFEFENDSLLTRLVFNNCIKEFLRPYIGDHADQITSHSFRAALPSTMGADPIAWKSVEVKQCGGGIPIVTYCTQDLMVVGNET